VLIHRLEDYQDQLKEAYEEGKKIIEEAIRAKRWRIDPEPPETALVADAHRWFWKPNDVKFIVVAESHVYTSEREISVKMRLDKLRAYDFPTDAPLGFVKLVYCLGYGVNEILSAPGMIDNSGGTWPYWRLFRRWTRYSKGTSIGWKLRVLDRMKEKGIWLLDASCHACSTGRKPPDDRLPVVKGLISTSWTKYVKPIVDDVQIDRESVWFIGKTVHDTIMELPGENGKYARESNWIYQPNVRVAMNSELYERKKAKEAQLEHEIWATCGIW
jgi:hypothetical protein